MIKYALSVKQSLLFTDLSLVGCDRKYFKKALNIDYLFPECLIRGDDIFWNYDNDISFDQAFLDNHSLNKAVEYFTNSLSKVTENLEKVTSKIVKSKRFDSKNKNDLQLIFNQYIEAYLLNTSFLFHFWNVENLLTSQLKKDFVETFGEDGETTLQQVLIPSKETYFSKERKSLEQIAIYFSKNPKGINLENMIDEHINNFGFTSFVLMLGSPQNRDSLLHRVRELLKEDLPKKIITRQKQEKQDNKEVQKILRKLQTKPEIYKRVLLTQELMFWKNQRLDILFKSDLGIKPLFDNLAKLMGFSYEEFVYLRYEDINIWFKNGKLPSRQEIKKRMQSYALYLRNGKILLYTDKNHYPKVKEDSEEKTSGTSGTIQGKSVYKGKVKGRVRIVNSMEDAKEIIKGEVLISKMTRSEMIIGLEKAAAFVTDQGGMLSHAAIVSREMKKPCIVGTKIATQVFKNGDFIEVDANQGIVRKLG